MKKNTYKSKFVRKTTLKRMINIYKILCLVLAVLLLFSFKAYADKKTVTVINKEILNPNVVMLGDSITDFYNLNEFYGEDKFIVNSGISGNRVSEILNDLKTRVYAYNPSKVFLLIGINDILWDGADENYVYEQTIAIVNQIHEKLPNTKIYIESIYPCNEEIKYHFKEVDINSLTSTIEGVNSKLKNYSKEKDYIKYIDLYNKLINEENQFDLKYSDDGLHPNEEGYKVITDILKKYM